MTFARFYKAVKAIAPPEKYFSVEIIAERFSINSELRIKYRAYVEGWGHTEECRNPSEVFGQLERMKKGTFKNTEADLNEIGDPEETLADV